jgi:hypothetical protein
MIVVHVTRPDNHIKGPPGISDDSSSDMLWERAQTLPRLTTDPDRKKWGQGSLNRRMSQKSLTYTVLFKNKEKMLGYISHKFLRDKNILIDY